MTIDADIKLPEFLTKEFLEKALNGGFKTNQIVITNLHITMGSKSGDNYCSDIYRAKITYKNGEKSNIIISLIIKAMPYLETRGPMLEELEVFDKEVKMYMDTLPKLSKLLNGERLAAK